MKGESIQTLVDELLLDQQQLTVVERFSKKHDRNQLYDRSVYKELIPLSKPKEGEQYAFEVDVDKCSGCKACVVACHSLNGLDETESWRDVGVLVGVGENKAAQQTITTACHHCEDPGCMNGCPTRAYEKDSETGIVRHLDDQCIGCRYCEMMCPYEVPKYNYKLGIVRKCDMCYGRLSEGEAPACVQACPNEAIKIRVVSKTGQASSEESLVPGVVPNSYTKPTTQFLNVDKETIPVDAGIPKLAHSHLPLVLMLVLTQAGVGLMLAAAASQMDLWYFLAGLGVFGAGLGFSILHLGQPLKAWKAFLGWRTSWLSREVMAFGAVGGMATVYLGAKYMLPEFFNFSLPEIYTHVIAGGLAFISIFAVWTSIMVYAKTKRTYWKLPYTTIRFFFTALGCGLLFAGSYFAAIPILTLVLLDALTFAGRLPQFVSNGRNMKLGSMPLVTVGRCLLACISLVILFFSPAAAVGCFISAELLGRYIFFRAVNEPSMPGGL